jgi:pimeloyl-ACP methyl ester carboxylesterase
MGTCRKRAAVGWPRPPIPLDNAQGFHEDISGGRLIVFDDLGYLPQEEDAARTVAVLDDFLGNLA